MGGCAPKERIKNMKDTARHSDYALWIQRCADGQTQDVCENNKWTDWCEWSPTDTGGFEGNSEAQAAVAANGYTMGFVVTRTPGESVGAFAREPIRLPEDASACDGSSCEQAVKLRHFHPWRTSCELLLYPSYAPRLNQSPDFFCKQNCANPSLYSGCPAAGRTPGGWRIDFPTEQRRIEECINVELDTGIWRTTLGLGTDIRYIQYTGGYCYYYQGGTSSGRSGPETWRYDPK